MSSQAFLPFLISEILLTLYNVRYLSDGHGISAFRISPLPHASKPLRNVLSEVLTSRSSTRRDGVDRARRQPARREAIPPPERLGQTDTSPGA
jgi:hypothetical protein